MPTVESTVTINAPLDAVYAISRDIEKFPEFMEDVAEVEILEEGSRQVSRWVSIIKQLKRTIKWTEEDFWNDEEHICRFNMIEGDFTEYSGVWTFTDDGAGGTEVQLTLDFAYEVPMIGKLIQGLLKQKTQENTDAMLAAIKARAEE